MMKNKRNSYYTAVKLAVQLDMLPDDLYKLIPKSSHSRFRHTDYSHYFRMVRKRTGEPTVEYVVEPVGLAALKLA